MADRLQLVKNIVPGRARLVAAGALSCLVVASSALAQDLDPRAYAKVPVGFSFAIAGLSASSGSVLTDPTVRVQNVHAEVWTPSAGFAQSFSLFGKTAQTLVALPFTSASVTGDVAEQAQRIERTGFSDMRVRLSVLLAGAPAMTARQMATSRRRPIVGASLTVSTPTGQYDPGHLINLGSNRWAFKPEIALSYPVAGRWLIDAYGGLWLFTGNGSYYPGTARRTQSPITALQTHVSYSLSTKAWAAFDATWYAGGQASVNGVGQKFPNQNSRVGATLAFPVGGRQSIKVAGSTGAVIRSGADFTTFSIGWQTGWRSRRTAQRAP